eukprot:XP_014043598.1 PREDICTED: uncharacterized protein LOC106596872 isoform X2 [Salmo salar]
MFKRSSKPAGHSVPVQEKEGMFKGILKKSPKPSQDVTHAQDHLSTDSELSSRRGSNDSLVVNINTKEKGGVFSGMFRKSPKPLEARIHSQGNLDDLSTHSDLSASTDSLSEKTSKDKERDEDLSDSREKLTFSDKHFEAKPVRIFVGFIFVLFLVLFILQLGTSVLETYLVFLFHTLLKK